MKLINRLNFIIITLLTILKLLNARRRVIERHSSGQPRPAFIPELSFLDDKQHPYDEELYKLWTYGFIGLGFVAIYYIYLSCTTPTAEFQSPAPLNVQTQTAIL